MVTTGTGALLPEGWYPGTVKGVAIVQSLSFKARPLREHLRVEVEVNSGDGPARVFYYVLYQTAPHPRSRLAALYRVCLDTDGREGGIPPIEALIGCEAEWRVVHRAGTSRLTGRPAIFVRIGDVRRPAG